MPARAFRQQEIDDRRHDQHRKPARQGQEPERIGIAGEQAADERQDGERGGQRHLVDGAVGAAVLRRHQFGGDREHRRPHAASAEAGQRPQDDQLFGILHQWDQKGEERRRNHADHQHGLAAQLVADRREAEAADGPRDGGAEEQPLDVGPGQMQRLLGQHYQRAGHKQIVALDKADEGEDEDDQDLVGAERNAVHLAPEHAAGGRTSRPHRRCNGHEPPRVRQPAALRGYGTGEDAISMLATCTFCGFGVLCRASLIRQPPPRRYWVDVLLLFARVVTARPSDCRPWGPCDLSMPGMHGPVTPKSDGLRARRDAAICWRPASAFQRGSAFRCPQAPASIVISELTISTSGPRSYDDLVSSR